MNCCVVLQINNDSEWEEKYVVLSRKSSASRVHAYVPECQMFCKVH